MKHIQELANEGCVECGAQFNKMDEVFPASISFVLAGDRTAWTRPRVVLLCRSCAASLEQQTNLSDEGGYFSE
jgi:5-methylcytosine-specific restriction endonuclease McrA